MREAADLQKELEQQLAKKPLDVAAEISLIKALAAQGYKEEAIKSAATFQRKLIDRYGQEARGTGSQLNWLALYCAGDFAGLERAAAAEPSSFARQVQSEALLEQGRIADAMKIVKGVAANEKEASWFLTLAIASQQAGDTKAAAEWRGKAVELMKREEKDHVRASAFLERATAPTADEIQEILLPPSDKAILLCALYQLHPEDSALAAAARRFNIDLAFPHHLIQRVTENAKLPAAEL